MQIRATRFDHAYLIESAPHVDDRGFLCRTYCEREFESYGLNTRWVQQNHTRTLFAGTVRGMHWQGGSRPEVKLVRCLVGRVWDVIVDIRQASPTFGQWEAFELSADSMTAVYIPTGFAHGFQCLDDDGCELLYSMSEFYEPAMARGVHCMDQDIGIDWPYPVANLSARDTNLPGLSSGS